MNPDTITIIHYGITAANAITVASVVAYFKFRSKKVELATEQAKTDHHDHQMCQQDFQELKTKVAVLSERVDNLIHLLERLDDKLSRLE